MKLLTTNEKRVSILGVTANRLSPAAELLNDLAADVNTLLDALAKGKRAHAATLKCIGPIRKECSRCVDSTFDHYCNDGECFGCEPCRETKRLRAEADELEKLR